MSDFTDSEDYDYMVRRYDPQLLIKPSKLFSRFNSGALIYQKEDDNLKVFVHVLNMSENFIGYFLKIKSIELPASEKEYSYLIISYPLHKFELKYYQELVRELNVSPGVVTYQKENAYRDEIRFLHIIARSMNEAEEFNVTNVNEFYEKISKMKSSQNENQKVLIEQVKNFIESVSFTSFCKAIEKRVIGQKNLRVFLSNVYLFLRNTIEGSSRNKHNIILTAPSGSGKTETYRALKEYFAKEIPELMVSIVDMNRITQEGFKGKDTDYLVHEFIEKKASYGILFMDEFDKKLRPSYTSNKEDVNANIQSQLLSVLEGIDLNGVDTSNILFVGMGSFDYLRKKREEVKSFGFAEDTDYGQKKLDLFDEITREDMLEVGGLTELIGRFHAVINYDRLSYEAVDRIIDLRLAELKIQFGFDIELSDRMREVLHENSNSRLGNRLIESLICEPLLMANVEILERNLSDVQVIVTDRNSYEIVSSGSIDDGDSKAAV